MSSFPTVTDTSEGDDSCVLETETKRASRCCEETSIRSACLSDEVNVVCTVECDNAGVGNFECKNDYDTNYAYNDDCEAISACNNDCGAISTCINDDCGAICSCNDDCDANSACNDDSDVNSAYDDLHICSATPEIQTFPIIKKGVRVACHNINRLINRNDSVKLDQLKLMLENDDAPVDVYCICETFLNNRSDDDYVSIDGFQTVRNDRTHKSGGGLIIYVRNGLVFKRRLDLETKSIEIIWLELKLPNKSLLLSLIYRPPDNYSVSVHNWLHHMEDYLAKLTLKTSPLY